MRDYLIRFATEAERDAAFPRPEGNPASWMVGPLTVVPVTVWMVAPTEEGRIAAPGFWIGAASTEPLAERHPATAVEMERPDVSTPWRDCIRWSAVAEIAPVQSVDPTFAGSDYIFD